MHVIYEVQTEHMDFKPGIDAEGLRFVSKGALETSTEPYAKLVYAYCV